VVETEIQDHGQSKLLKKFREKKKKKAGAFQELPPLLFYGLDFDSFLFVFFFVCSLYPFFFVICPSFLSHWGRLQL
jgi:hypothetical protein